MINLLPPEVKQSITYGRRNAVLVKWIIAIVIVITGIAAMNIFGWLYINQNVHNQQKLVSLTQNRISSQNLEAAKNQLQDLSDKVKTIVQILNKQLLFSKMLTTIGSILPDGSVLSNINLSTTDSALDLSVSAVSRDAATQAFVNISDPANNFFDKADLVSITCETPSTKKYPCTAQVRVTLKNNSSFYFMNTVTANGGAKS